MTLTHASAGSRQQKGQSSAESSGQRKRPLLSPILKKPISQNMEQASAGTKAQEISSNTLPRQAKEGAADAQKKARSVHRQGKGSKKAKAQAVIKPHTDLTYHGILENPSRYDPRHNRQTAGTPDPQTSELTHDHFQELDHNRDGKIDPVERTFGRLDMDRDLSARHWQ
jgi:hypothetical protein